MSEKADGRHIVSTKRVVAITKIDSGRTVAIEFETGSGAPLFILLPAAAAADLATRIVEARPNER